MAAPPYVLGALLWLHLAHGCEQLQVSQGPQVTVALTGTPVPIDCHIHFTNRAIGTPIYSAVERANPAGPTKLSEQAVSTPDTNGTETITHSIRADGQSAMYYCVATCLAPIKSSSGTYIHVRDNGFVRPPDPSSRLQSSLIALLVLLLLLSATGTALLLLPFIWKRKGDSPPMPHSSTDPRGSKSPQGDKEASSSVYASLTPRPDSQLYDTLEKATPLPKGKVLNVETHQSPKAKPTPQVKPTAAQGPTRGGSKRPALKSQEGATQNKICMKTSNNRIFGFPLYPHQYLLIKVFNS
uniref:Provisional ortholog of NFAT activating protein with ITAM motif 1 n=1 Tax=Xenopus tropicalis TaxID=8364 RepID=A0A803J4C0_XENTR